MGKRTAISNVFLGIPVVVGVVAGILWLSPSAAQNKAIEDVPEQDLQVALKQSQDAINPFHTPAKIFSLKQTCPAGFSLEQKQGAKQRGCYFQSLYTLYPSIQDHGVGGLKTDLPPIRDGFSPEVIDLGRYLFFDPILSGNQKLSCASCHDPDLGFADGKARSVGASGEPLSRSAPSLWNVGFLDRLFWDARAESLEEQAQGPLYSMHEMANTPEKLLSVLQADETYSCLFAQAFKDENTNVAVTLDRVYQALAAFQSTLVSFNSRYDQYAHGYHQALNAQEIEGLNLFRSFVARCSECHTPPLFTNKQTAVIGTPEPPGMPYDKGAEIPQNNSTLRGAFKVPTLRNIVKSAPYMHSGRFKDLRSAVAFYNGGRGHAVPDAHKKTVRLHWHIWDPQLKENEIDRLVDFLGTLTDEKFMPEVPQYVPSGLPVSRAVTTNEYSQ